LTLIIALQHCVYVSTWQKYHGYLFLLCPTCVPNGKLYQTEAFFIIIDVLFRYFLCVTTLACDVHCVNLAIWLLYVNKPTYLITVLRVISPTQTGYQQRLEQYRVL